MTYHFKSQTTTYWIFVLLTTALVSCTHSNAPTEKGNTAISRSAATSGMSSSQTNQCKLNGGTLKKVCMKGDWHCVIPYEDAGSPCSDNSECQGDCRIYSGSHALESQNNELTGQCAKDNNPCGCWGNLVNGKSRGILCRD